MGASGAGKSTLAADLITAGAALINDDLTPIRWLEDCWTIVPVQPQLKLWPDSAQQVLSPEIRKTTYHDGTHRISVGEIWGQWSPEPQSLSALYILCRAPQSKPRLEAISGQRAATMLIQQSALAPLIPALGLQTTLVRSYC